MNVGTLRPCIVVCFLLFSHCLFCSYLHLSIHSVRVHSFLLSFFTLLLLTFRSIHPSDLIGRCHLPHCLVRRAGSASSGGGDQIPFPWPRWARWHPTPVRGMWRDGGGVRGARGTVISSPWLIQLRYLDYANAAVPN